MLELIHRLKKCDGGATAVEYGLLISLSIIAMIVSLGNVADKSNSMWNNVSNKTTSSTIQ